MTDIACKRCGLCCYIEIDGKPSNKKCRHLVILKSGRTLCRIYTNLKNRLGKDLGSGNACVSRKDSPFDYEGCPYNTDKPIIYLDSDGRRKVKDEVRDKD
jgi:hypothetical protein